MHYFCALSSLSEQEAALLMQLSGSRFRHLFKELTGLSFRAMRIRIRLARGAELLDSTDATVDEISVLLCYTDRAAFDNAFKALYKLRPAQYRRTVRHIAKNNSHLAHIQPQNSAVTSFPLCRSKPNADLAGGKNALDTDCDICVVHSSWIDCR